MRAVFDALERLGVRYFVTGSVAASVYGVLRQSHDTDVVLVDAARFMELAEALGGSCLIADPIAYGAFSMASIVERDTADKVDVIVAPSGAFEASAMERRQRAEVPASVRSGSPRWRISCSPSWSGQRARPSSSCATARSSCASMRRPSIGPTSSAGRSASASAASWAMIES